MKKHKIIDTIFLYDEIDMLLFRFTELNEYVDHFIVMESNIDFLGNLKPFFFLENQNLFENWKDKITYLPTSDITLEMNPGGGIVSVPKGLGTLCFFPSFLLHRVTPLTSGVRKSLVTWISGANFR